MQIDEIEVINLHFTYPDPREFFYRGGYVTSRLTSLVRVHTQEGFVGLGTAYSHPDLLRIIIEKHLKPFLIGANALEVEALWEKMYGLTRWYGRKGVALSALGALDTAFWDLRGKALGKPLYKLLGSERASVPAYASGMFWKDDVNLLEKEAARHRSRGFRRVKMRLGRGEAYDVAALEAAQRGVGRDGEVLVDGSHLYSLEEAERIGRVLSEKKVFWFEEPFPPEDIDSYVALRPRLEVPLAAGENEFGVQGFRELLRAGAVDIAQPDVSRAGGITECLRIGRLAGRMEARVATHTWSDAVAVIANAHVVAALTNGITVEVDQTGNPFIDELLVEPLDIKDGLLRLPEAPGLGITLNESTLNRVSLPRDQSIPDGNYWDLIFGAQHFSVAPPYEAKTR